MRLVNYVLKTHILSFTSRSTQGYTNKLERLDTYRQNGGDVLNEGSQFEGNVRTHQGPIHRLNLKAKFKFSTRLKLYFSAPVLTK